jgi:hypothetical protein
MYSNPDHDCDRDYDRHCDRDYDCDCHLDHDCNRYCDRDRDRDLAVTVTMYRIFKCSQRWKEETN